MSPNSLLQKLTFHSIIEQKGVFIMNRYSNIIKQEAINLYKSGTHAVKVAESLSITRSTVYKWLKGQDNIPHNITKSSFILLENKVKQLNGIIEIFQGHFLKSLSVTQSFSRAYLPYDNSVMESFFSSLKREELYRTKYHS